MGKKEEQKKFLYKVLDKSLELWNELKGNGLARVEDFVAFVKEAYENNYIVEIDMDEVYKDLDELCDVVGSLETIEDVFDTFNSGQGGVYANRWDIGGILTDEKNGDFHMYRLHKELSNDKLKTLKFDGYGDYLDDIRFKFNKKGEIEDVTFDIMVDGDWYIEENMCLTMYEVKGIAEGYINPEIFERDYEG